KGSPIASVNEYEHWGASPGCRKNVQSLVLVRTVRHRKLALYLPAGRNTAVGILLKKRQAVGHRRPGVVLPVYLVDRISHGVGVGSHHGQGSSSSAYSG